MLVLAVDPRFKQLNILDHASVVNDVKHELTRRMERDASEQASDNEPPAKKKRTAMDVLLGEEDSSDSSTIGSETRKLEYVFSDKAAACSTNPLTWWKENSSKYLNLAKIAQSLLHAPNMSTPSERVFSKTGLTVTKLKSSLKPKSVDAIIFLNKNLELLK